jgi:hypothetical protein
VAKKSLKQISGLAGYLPRMTTTLTSNLNNMKAATLLNIPVLLPDNEITTTQTAASTRQFRVGWAIPCVAVLAALIAFAAFTSLAQINADLDAMAVSLQSPQF